MKTITALTILALAIIVMIAWFNIINWVAEKVTDNYNVQFGVEFFLLLAPLVVIAIYLTD